MHITTGIAATVTLKANPAASATETDVRSILFAAFPKLMGQGTEIEHVDGADWLVTLPTEQWTDIQSVGYFEFGAELDAHRWAKIAIEADQQQ